MNILIPIDAEKNLCSMKENKSWAVVSIDEGQTKKISFYASRQEITDFTQYIVVISKEEFISDFFLEGIGILIAPMQKSIEDIIEAYMFKELHELTS